MISDFTIMTTINVRQCHPEFRAFFSLKVFSISRYHILQFWKYHLFTVKFHFSILTFCWGVNQKRNHSLLLSRNTPMNFRNWERNEENLENLHMLKIDFKERINFRVFPSQTTQNMNEKHEKPTSHHEYTYIYILNFWYSAIMQ